MVLSWYIGRTFTNVPYSSTSHDPKDHEFYGRERNRHIDLNAQFTEQESFDAANGKKLGHLFVREGKSKNARRHVSLTPVAQEMLVSRSLESKSEYVFANYAGKPYLVTSLDHLHKKLSGDLQLPKDCVIHSLRHTFLTRFGEAGADTFTIKKVAGHSSVTISERYIHPTPEGQERAFERFANLNQRAAKKAENDAESLQIPLHSDSDRS